MDKTKIIEDLVMWNNLSIDDDESDQLKKVLTLLVDNALSLVALYLGKEEKEVPESVTVVVSELAQAKFVKRGKEGASSFSEEGYSLSYSMNDLDVFKSLLDPLKEDQGVSIIKGRAVSWS